MKDAAKEVKGTAEGRRLSLLERALEAQRREGSGDESDPAPPAGEPATQTEPEAAVTEEAPSPSAEAPGATGTPMEAAPAAGLPKATESQETASEAQADAASPLSEAPVPVDAQPVPDKPTAEIDLSFLAARGFLTAEAGDSVLAHEYRRIKRPLLKNVSLRASHAQACDRSNLLLVTSSVAGEGKTFVSANLAISIAFEVDRTVLLIDADGARAGLTNLFMADRMPGLSDVLAGNVSDFGDVIRDTSVRNLRFVPAGTPFTNLDELFASEAMTHLVDEISERYADRIVIFDSAPLLQTSESSVLAGLVGQTVFVVEADRTNETLVKDALALLPDLDSVGLVLNKASRHMGPLGYGYAYRSS